MRRDEETRYPMTRRVLLTLLALLLVAGVCVAGFALPRLDAITTLLRFASGGSGDDGELLEGMAHEGSVQRLGFARVLVARPEGAGPHPTLVFVHGVAVNGLDDARVIEAIGIRTPIGFV